MKISLVLAGLTGAVFMFAAHLPRGFDQVVVFAIGCMLAVVAALDGD